MSSPLPSVSPNINLATYFARRASTSAIKKKSKGIGIGEVGGKVYANLSGTAQELFDMGQNAGTLAAVTGLTVAEYGLFGVFHRTVFTLAAVPITLLDTTVGAGTKFYDFPLGQTLILAASGQVAETTTSVLSSTLNTGITYNWGVGTVTQANGTLATTEQDIIPTTNGVASATINVAGAISKGVRTATPATFDGHSSAKSAFFNVGVASATDIDGDATTLWTGTIEIVWMLSQAGN